MNGTAIPSLVSNHLKTIVDDEDAMDTLKWTAATMYFGAAFLHSRRGLLLIIRELNAQVEATQYV